MTDIRFYNAGGRKRGLLGRVMSLIRRVLRRVLRPIFQRQVELYGDLYARSEDQSRSLHQQGVILQSVEQRTAELFWRADSIDNDVDAVNQAVQDLSRHLAAVQALAWDYAAMARRLALLEDRLIELSGGGSQPTSLDGQKLLPLPITQLQTPIGIRTREAG